MQGVGEVREVARAAAVTVGAVATRVAVDLGATRAAAVRVAVVEEEAGRVARSYNTARREASTGDSAGYRRYARFDRAHSRQDTG